MGGQWTYFKKIQNGFNQTSASVVSVRLISSFNNNKVEPSRRCIANKQSFGKEALEHNFWCNMRTCGAVLELNTSCIFLKKVYAL